MSKVKTKGSEKAAFEILNSGNESVVYKRIVNPKGRNPKKLHEIEMSLPTATVHLFNQKDFENLKKIEMEIHSGIATKKSNKGILNQIGEWFEID